MKKLSLLVLSSIIAINCLHMGSTFAGISENCAASHQGYWMVASDGGVFTYGDAQFFGSTGNMRLNAPIVGMAVSPYGDGYWLVASDGGIFSFGNVPFYGSTGSLKLNAPIIGMRSTGLGDGYWLFAKDGGVFAFGNATYLGTPYVPYYPTIYQTAVDAGSVLNVMTLPYEISDGYAIVSSIGTVLTFGAVPNYGSYYGNYNNQTPYVEIAVASDGYSVQGYWLARSDGSIYSFGSVPFYGSAGNLPLQKPIVSMITENDNTGYRLIGSDGGVFTYGSSKFCGSTGNIKLVAPIVDAFNGGFSAP